ncbi:MAG: transposase [Patescibacteria group bacterium]
MRKTPFVSGEYYHIYNRGVDKRITFLDEADVQRFYDSMEEFNTLEPIGSIYENAFAKRLGSRTSKSGVLVNFIAYCVNPNHFHFLIRQESKKGIEKFMQRIGTGYTKYFNNKNKRSGALFQGKFKSIHVNSNEYLLYVSAYVNLNDRVHQFGSPTSKLVKSKSSWKEYIKRESGEKQFCTKDIILGQFRNVAEYKEFALSALESILEGKTQAKELAIFLLE